MVRRKSKIEFI